MSRVNWIKKADSFRVLMCLYRYDTIDVLTQTDHVIQSATVYHFLYDGGITLRSGQRGFAVYRDEMVVAQFIPILLGCRMDLIDYQRLMSFCPVK